MCDFIHLLFIASFCSPQWRFPRVSEPAGSLPKDKAFSIAAALPVPFYGSLLDDLSNVGLHGKEQPPFSQDEHSAQHVAQQLSLLQQVDAHCLVRVRSSGFTPRGRHVLVNCTVRPSLLLTAPPLILTLYLFKLRGCSKDVIQFISSTPESRASGTK